MTAPTSVQERRERLLADPRVSGWFKNRGKRSTAESYLSNLELFLRRTSCDIGDLVKIAKARRSDGEDLRFPSLVLEWVETERKAGRPDAYLATIWAAVRSFLGSIEAAPDWVPKLKVRAATTIADEIVPTPEQLRAVLGMNPTPRTRATILLLATSGIRPGVLGSRTTPAGLRLRDLPDLDIKTLEFRRVPFRIVVPADLSKGGDSYSCFATQETATELLAYLRHRRNERKEKLVPASAVIGPEPKTPETHRRVAEDGIEFLREKGLGDMVRLALAKARPAGVRWRPYALRGFASSQLMVAENAQLVTRDQREYLLGHATDIGRRYNLGKGRMSTVLEEDLREAYSRAADRFLRILTVSDAGVDYRPVLRVLLASAGYSKKEVGAMGDLSEEQVIEAIRAKRAEGREVPTPKAGENARVVSTSELGEWLGKGWKPISPAGADRYVVGAPN